MKGSRVEERKEWHLTGKKRKKNESTIFRRRTRKKRKRARVSGRGRGKDAMRGWREGKGGGTTSSIIKLGESDRCYPLNYQGEGKEGKRTPASELSPGKERINSAFAIGLFFRGEGQPDNLGRPEENRRPRRRHS